MRWMVLAIVISLAVGCSGKAPETKKKTSKKPKKSAQVAERSPDRLPAPPPPDPNEPPPREKQTYVIQLPKDPTAESRQTGSRESPKPSAEIIEPIKTIQVFKKEAVGMSISADGKRLAVAGFDAEYDDHSMRVYDVETEALMHEFKGDIGGYDPIVLSPNGLQAVLRLARPDVRDGWGTVVDVDTGKAMALLETKKGHRTTADRQSFAPNGESVFLWDILTDVFEFDVSTGKEIRDISAGDHLISTFALFPDGKKMAIGGYNGGVRIHDLESGKDEILDPGGPEPRVPNDATQEVRTIAVSPDGQSIAIHRLGQGVAVWDLPTKSKLRDFDLHTRWVHAMLFLGGHRYFVAQGNWVKSSGETDYERNCDPLYVFDTETGRHLAYLNVPTSTPQNRWASDGVATADGKRLFVGLHDGSVRIFDVSRWNDSHGEPVAE